jgi:hypothetical protein
MGPPPLVPASLVPASLVPAISLLVLLVAAAGAAGSARAQPVRSAPDTADTSRASVFEEGARGEARLPGLAPADTTADTTAASRAPLPEPERTGVKRTLIRRYQAARHRLLARRMLDARPRPVPVRGPAWLPVSDTLGLAVGPAHEPAPDRRARGFPVGDVRVVPHLGHGWFTERFEDTDWSYLGTSRALSLFDTTRTRELRARMQAQFGAPTRTLGDFESAEAREEAGHPQFEYWFVVNGELPVIVSDVDGPRDRGVILATAARHRDSLKALRRALLAPIRAPERSAYADYYHEPETGRWYRTGFDGRAFFRERVYPYEIVPGRRAWVDPVTTDPAHPDASTSGSAGRSASETEAPGSR